MKCQHSFIRSPIKTHPGFSGRNTNQISHENVRSTTIVKSSGSSRVTRSLRIEVLTNSPINQRKTQKAKCTKNNIKEKVRNSKQGNSNKFNERDFCTERKENCCVTKQERSWIKCSVCEKLLHQNCIIFSETCIAYGRNNNLNYREKLTKYTEK